MTKRDILEIALKVFGLYMLTVGIDSLAQLIVTVPFAFHSSIEGLVYVTINSLRTIFYLFGFWLLTFRTDYLTQKLIKSNPDATILLTIDKADLLQVLFMTSGIIITVSSISHIWTALTQGALWEHKDIPDKHRYLMYLTQFAIPITKGIIGLILIFASAMLARVLTRTEKSYNR